MKHRLRVSLPVAACFAGALIVTNGDCSYEAPAAGMPAPRYILVSLNNQSLPSLFKQADAVSTFVVADTLTFVGLTYNQTTVVRIDSAGVQSTRVFTISRAVAVQAGGTGDGLTKYLRLPRFYAGADVPMEYTGLGFATVRPSDGKPWQYHGF